MFGGEVDALYAASVALSKVEVIEGGGSMAKVPEVLEEARRDEAVGRAAAYFTRAGQHDAPFTGANFESVGHRWDDSGHTNEITAADLVALALLSVPAQGRAVQRVLSDEFQSEASALLEGVPGHASIGDPLAFAKWLAPGAPMHRLWCLVFDVQGFGKVSTSKLLARKRASLIPVNDAMITTGWDLQANENSWEAMHSLLSDNGASVLALGDHIRVAARVPSYVSPLRVLDAVVWHAGKFPYWTPKMPVEPFNADSDNEEY